MRHEITIERTDSGQRVDKYLRSYFKDVPLSRIFKAFRKKDVKINGTWVKEQEKITTGDVLTVYLVSEPTQTTPPRMLPLTFKVMYEDDAVLVVDKPVGLPVHGGTGIGENTLINQVKQYLGTDKARLVHRIDKQTSGLVLLAKSRDAAEVLGKDLKGHMMHKEYLAVVSGCYPKQTDVWQSTLEREGEGRSDKKISKGEKGKCAETKITVKKQNNKYTLLLCNIVTGRMHQIRVQAKDAGFPLLGDDRYGDFALNKELRKVVKLQRMMLHSHLLCFDHPITKKRLEVVSSLPADMNHIITLLMNEKN